MGFTSKWLPLGVMSFISFGVSAANYEIDKHWSFLAEYVYLKRDEISPRPLVKDAAKPHISHCYPTTVVLTPKNLLNSFDWESGGRLGLAYRPDIKSIYEARFMYVWPWSYTEVIKGDFTLSFPFKTDTFTEDYNTASQATAYYNSQFYTFDLNYWRNSGLRGKDYFVISGIFGLRFFQIKEKFNIAFLNYTFSGTSQSNYQAKTLNDAIGIQGGFDFQMNPYSHFNFDIFALGGLGLNRAYESVFLGDVNNTVIIRKFTKDHAQNVVFADVEMKLGYEVIPGLNFHAGYQMFYASGLALAPNELSYNVNPLEERFNHTRYVIIHGILVGMNCDF